MTGLTVRITAPGTATGRASGLIAAGAPDAPDAKGPSPDAVVSAPATPAMGSADTRPAAPTPAPPANNARRDMACQIILACSESISLMSGPLVPRTARPTYSTARRGEPGRQQLVKDAGDLPTERWRATACR